MPLSRVLILVTVPASRVYFVYMAFAGWRHIWYGQAEFQPHHKKTALNIVPQIDILINSEITESSSSPARARGRRCMSFLYYTETVSMAAVIPVPIVLYSIFTHPIRTQTLQRMVHIAVLWP